KFVPSAYRLAYLPRTPWLKSYSASMSGSRLALAAFFIILPFAAGRYPCTDDANLVAALGEDHDQEPLALGLSEVDKAVFLFGVQRIVNRPCERIAENGTRFFERHAVLFEVLLGFAISTAEEVREGVSPPPGKAGLGHGAGRGPSRGMPGVRRRKCLQAKWFRGT